MSKEFFVIKVFPQNVHVGKQYDQSKIAFSESKTASFFVWERGT